MYPSSLRMRAISSFIREVGIEADSCIARFTLRMRVSMSAMGSVSTLSSLPARFRHARDRALVGELAEADPADTELAVHGARTSAAVAARVAANLVLRVPLLLDDERLLGHYSCSLLSVANGMPNAARSARPCSSV